MNNCKLLLIAIVAAIIISSCHSSHGSLKMHPPGVGTYFKYKHWYTFADAPPEGPHIGLADSVLNQDTAMDGKDHVLIHSRKSLISYESNGDISWYFGQRQGPDQPDGWERIPLASKDTVAFIKGKNNLGNLVVDTLSYLESKDTTIEGHFWHAIKIRHIVSLDGHTYNNEVLWFDAETGWYLRMDMQPRHPFEPGLASNGEEVHVYECKIVR